MCYTLLMANESNSHSTPERRIQSITFDEMVVNLYKERSGFKKEPKGKGRGCYFTKVQTIQNQPYEPYLYARVTPPMISRAREGIGNLLFSINSPNNFKWTETMDNRADLAAGFFEVYDFDVSKLNNSSVTDDLIEIRPGQVLVPNNDADAKTIGSWVTNSHVRARINEYSGDYEKRQHIKKYIQLRKAPFEKHNVPGYVYTYEGVKHEATAKTEMTTSGRAPKTFRRFTLEDLAWLQTYMRNKGIPIPPKTT